MDTFLRVTRKHVLQLEDGSAWMYSLEEISASGSAKQLRSSFAVILQFCRPSEPNKIFQQFIESMSDDFVYHTVKVFKCTRDDVDDDNIRNQVLIALDEELSEMGGSIKDFPDMPQPVALSEEERQARLIQEEHYDISQPVNIVNTMTPLMNTEQSTLCESIYEAVHSSSDAKIRKMFVLNAPGGQASTI